MKPPRPLKTYGPRLGTEALEAWLTVPVCPGCRERVLWRLGWVLCEACYRRHLDMVRTAPRASRGSGPRPPATVRAHKTRDREGALYTRCTELFYAGLLHDFHIVDVDSWHVRYDDGTEPVEWCADVLRKELAARYGDAALGTGFFVYGRRRYWEPA